LPHFARFARTFKGCFVGTADHFAFQKRQPFARRHNACKILKQMRAAGFKTQALRAKRKTHHKGAFFFLTCVSNLDTKCYQYCAYRVV
jgi:hypothetical protein